MTITDTLTCLRDIQADWSRPTIPAEKLSVLEAASLVESRAEPEFAVRLTPAGARCKAIAESSHTRAARPAQEHAHHSRTQRKQRVAAPKPLV
jgi:hypothetical protein